jgi:hypothetical protein
MADEEAGLLLTLFLTRRDKPPNARLPREPCEMKRSFLAVAFTVFIMRS